LAKVDAGLTCKPQLASAVGQPSPWEGPYISDAFSIPAFDLVKFSVPLFGIVPLYQIFAALAQSLCKNMGCISES
jgi:hypothetical protein